jgi:hypothetical protein
LGDKKMGLEISDIEFNKVILELSRFEEILVKNSNAITEDLCKKKLELIDKYNPLLTDDEQIGYFSEYKAYLSEKIKKYNLEA